jgi:hypothetical protein
MLKKIIPVFVALFLAGPITSFALEQSFTQNGLKAGIKLTPDELTAGEEVNLSIRVEKDGLPVTDRKVALEIYENDTTEPVITRDVDFLDDEYLDSWSFAKPGDYKVMTSIVDPQHPDEALHYEVKASVGAARSAGDNDHERHGFFAHAFGGKWGWWGAGLMLLVMVPMMIVGL